MSSGFLDNDFHSPVRLGYDTERTRFTGDGLLRSEARPGTNPVVIGGLDDRSPDGVVHRKLKARHVQMIAIGGTIGTGLFVGSGAALSNGGPVGLLLGYLIMGTVVYSMVVALGEMTTLFPVSGSFTHYATRWLDPAIGFALGYNYWYTFAIALPAEITAAAIVISYWDRTTNAGVWITIFFVVIVFINFCAVKYYGEAEFWFALIKVTTIVGLIILGIVLDLGGGPTHERVGFRYWKNPGPFNQLHGIPGAKGRFFAFWATFLNSAFSFLGTEIVAIAAAEVENPRRNVPRAIRRVFYRILLFYVGGVIVIGWLVPYNDSRLLGASGTASSPFVIAVQNAQIKALPSIINAVVLTSAFSAGNSVLYASSRTLYGLACAGQAPRFLRKCTKEGLPIWCVFITSFAGFLAYLNVNTNGGTVFGWFVDITSITGLITWDIILITYVRFYQGLAYHGISRDKLPYKAPFQPYASYFGIFCINLIIFFNGFQVFLSNNWSVNNFVAAYISLPIFLIFYFFWKILMLPKFVRVADMDFTTGRRELNKMEEEELAKYIVPKGIVAEVWDWLM